MVLHTVSKCGDRWNCWCNYNTWSM